VPPLQEKRFWRRYIYLWINYAIFEELQAKDMERTREVYRQMLKVVNTAAAAPHTHTLSLSVPSPSDAVKTKKLCYRSDSFVERL
jgi:hypothetical protein